MHVWKVRKRHTLCSNILQTLKSNHVLKQTFKNQYALFCTFRYLYADLYAGAVWAGTETPEGSGNFTTSKIPFSCAKDTPIQCISIPGSDFPSLGYILSFGEDNRKDIFVLASSGVYRVVRPSRCSYTCSKENVTNVASPSPSTSPPSNAGQSHCQYSRVLVLFSSLLLLLLGVM